MIKPTVESDWMSRDAPRSRFPAPFSVSEKLGYNPETKNYQNVLMTRHEC
jgi:hypothetical protein